MSDVAVALAGVGLASIFLVSTLSPPTETEDRMTCGSHPTDRILWDLPSGLRLAYRHYPAQSEVAFDPLDSTLEPYMIPDYASKFRDRYH